MECIVNGTGGSGPKMAYGSVFSSGGTATIDISGHRFNTVDAVFATVISGRYSHYAYVISYSASSITVAEDSNGDCIFWLVIGT